MIFSNFRCLFSWIHCELPESKEDSYSLPYLLLEGHCAKVYVNKEKCLPLRSTHN